MPAPQSGGRYDGPWRAMDGGADEDHYPVSAIGIVLVRTLRARATCDREARPDIYSPYNG